MKITDNGSRLSKTEWLGITAFVLDTHNTLDHVSTGLNEQVNRNICEHANAEPVLAPLRTLWAKRGLIEADEILRLKDVSHIAPRVADFYRQRGPDYLHGYLRDVYTGDFGKIAPQPDFVEAVRNLRGDGRDEDPRVVLYTDQPYAPPGQKPFFVNKVLEAIGFEPEDFFESEVVDLLKIDRNPHLRFKFSSHLKPREIFDKSTGYGFVHACDTFGIKPMHGGYGHVAYLDDEPSHFMGINSSGVNGILIGTSDTPLEEIPGGNHARECVWQNERDEQGRFFSTAGCILAKVAAIKYVGPRGRRYSTKGHYIQEGERPWYKPDFARLEP